MLLTIVSWYCGKSYWRFSLRISSLMCRALLYGGMRESQPEAEIPLQDTTAEAFTMLLKYIYTGRATLTDEKEEVLLDFLSLAHKYGFPELEDSTSEYLCTILNIQNVCMTFDVASLYSLPKLTCMCCLFMDRNAQEVLSSEGFLSLSKVCHHLQELHRHALYNLDLCCKSRAIDWD